MAFHLNNFPWFKMITDNHGHATRSNTVNVETGSNKTTLGNNLFVPYATYYGIRSRRVEGPAHWNKVHHNISQCTITYRFFQSLEPTKLTTCFRTQPSRSS